MIDPLTHEILTNDDVPTIVDPHYGQVAILTFFATVVFFMLCLWVRMWMLSRQRAGARKFSRFVDLPLDANDREVLIHSAAYHQQFGDGLNTPLYAGQPLSRECAARIAKHHHLAACLRGIADKLAPAK